MTNKITNDFRVFVETNRHNDTMWVVRVGGRSGNIVSSLRNEADAIYIAEKCNEDHWYMNRGDSLAERVARSNLNSG
jgi:hypothetical protein